MNFSNILNIGNEILAKVSYDIELYEKISLSIVQERERTNTISNKVLIDSNLHLDKLRKKDRFLSYAISTFITCLDHQKVNNSELATFFSLHGQLAINLNASKKSLWASNKAVKLINNESNIILVKSYSQIATASRNLGKYADAIEYYKKAKQHAEYLNRLDLAAWQFFRLGKMYANYLQQTSRSLQFLTTAKKNFSKIDSYFGKRGVSSSYDEIGDLYRQHASNIARAITFYNDAKTINEEIGYQDGIARNLAHLGLCEEKKGNLDAARNYLEKSIQMLRNIHHQDRGLAIRLGQISRVCLKQNNIAMAEEYLNESSKLNNYYYDIKQIASNKIYIGQLYRKKMEYNQAKKEFNDAIYLSKKHNFNRIQIKAYKNLAEVISSDLEDYNSAKDVVLEELKVRKNDWELIDKDSINLEKAEDKKEIAVMYKSLFRKLLEDSQENFDKALAAVSKAYNAALEERNQKLVNVSKIFKLGALMTGVRHESSNIFNEIFATNQLVLKDSLLNAESRKILIKVQEKILSGIGMLHDDFIHELLSTNSSISNIKYSVKTILPPIFEWLFKEHQSNNINIYFPSDIPDLETDVEPNVFRMSLSIVINNACEAFDSSKSNNFIRIEAKSFNSYLILSVTDNGIGIEIEKLKEIFNVGTSGKKSHLGLGMPTIKYLLESVGGGVSVSSESGKKTEVSLKIPAKKIAGGK